MIVSNLVQGTSGVIVEDHWLGFFNFIILHQICSCDIAGNEVLSSLQGAREKSNVHRPGSVENKGDILSVCGIILKGTKPTPLKII